MTNFVTFVAYSQNTPITAGWLNDVGIAVYQAIGNGSNVPPTTPAQVLTNLGIGTPTPSETPSGLINGSNLTYTLSHTPLNGIVPLYINGVYIRPVIDYTLTTNSILLIVGGTSSIAAALSGNDWIAAGPYYH